MILAIRPLMIEPAGTVTCPSMFKSSAVRAANSSPSWLVSESTAVSIIIGILVPCGTTRTKPCSTCFLPVALVVAPEAAVASFLTSGSISESIGWLADPPAVVEDVESLAAAESLVVAESLAEVSVAAEGAVAVDEEVEPLDAAEPPAASSAAGAFGDSSTILSSVGVSSFRRLLVSSAGAAFADEASSAGAADDSGL